MRLLDKVTIVTGAGAGIGQGIAERFGREGARVVVADWLETAAKETVERIASAGGEAVAVWVDVTKQKAVEAMVAHVLEEYGRVDVLVNNAASAEGDDILDIDEATWDQNVEVVLKSIYLCSRAVLPTMIEQKGGAIINIGSVNGMVGLGMEAYSAGKAGLVSLTKNMALKYGRHRIRANVISPGTIHTPMWEPRLEYDPHVFDRFARWYPLGRVGKPEDVANAAVFLASDEASWITGINLPVDGGLTVGLYRMIDDLEEAPADEAGMDEAAEQEGDG